MQLARLATVYLPELTEDRRRWAFESELMKVEVLRARDAGDEIQLLLAATGPLAYQPKRTLEGRVVINDKARKTLEFAIENIGNLLTVSTGCKRRIMSPLPVVALIPDSADERSWLNESSGILYPQAQRFFQCSPLNIPFELVVTRLSDRPDGVSLLSEVITHEHSVGKFHDIYRLFERGFSKTSKNLVTPLFDFLHEDYGYTKSEVGQWIQMRDPMTHADKRNDFLVEADVAACIPRMEQAAYDVLMNKMHWRSHDVVRRDLWKPPYGTTGTKGGFFAADRQDLKMNFTVMDPYGSWECDPSVWSPPLPKGWWWAAPDEIIIDDIRR